MKEQVKKSMERKYDFQERLISFAVRIINVSEKLPNTKVGQHIALQMLRSGTSPAANYGEAQGAESKNDFIHKLKISLKKLRETEVWLKIIVEAKLIEPPEKLSQLIQENDELISIIYKSIETAKTNNER